ncbi:MAG: STAS domain-containing protein [Rhodobacterales bacterium]|nr:STAS domain-containing protein [Rhodobacterales bacterium]
MTEPIRKLRDTAVVTLEGVLDHYNGAQVRRQLLAALEQARDVVVDFSRVTWADSSAAANLVEALRLARGNGGDLALVAVRPAVMKLLELVRLDRIFPIHETLDGALGAGSPK